MNVFWRLSCNLCTGSFGTVNNIVIDYPSGAPCSPEVAMKKLVMSPKQGPKCLLREAVNLVKPKCASGVSTTDEQGNLFLSTSVVILLTQIYCLGRQILTKSAIMEAPLSVVYNCKPDNLGIIQKETTTVVADVNGQPCDGPQQIQIQLYFWINLQIVLENQIQI